MASNKLIEAHRDGAEIHAGETSREKIPKLMEEFSLPKGFFPLDKVQEIGFNRPQSFIWIRMKEKTQHKFKKIGQLVIYNDEITASIGKGRLSKVTGIKAKEMFVTLALSDLVVGIPSPDMIKFTSSIGITRTYPVSAFELEDAENGGK